MIEHVSRSATVAPERAEAVQHDTTHGQAPINPFSIVLARLRMARKLSQAQLARAIDLNHAHISRLEGETRMPSRETVEALADALHAVHPLTTDERRMLFTSAGFSVPDSPEIAQFRMLGEEWQRKALAFVELAMGDVA